jgi:hypothetical protein
VFNSTATTVADALEFVGINEYPQPKQHPNVPQSRPPSANSSGSFSSNTDSGSISQGIAERHRRMTKVPIYFLKTKKKQ